MIRPGSPRDEHGAAVAASVLLMGVLLSLTIACVAVVGLVATHRQTQAAADLAALAGAAALQSGGDPCQRAGAVAGANKADLARCRVDGFEVAVEVRAFSRAWLGERATLRARARAGPESVGGLAPR